MNPIEAFESLEFEDKLKLVFAGQFIKSIDIDNRTLSLYLLEMKYYVEVYSKIGSKEIDYICPASNERLPLYIDLDKLMS